MLIFKDTLQLDKEFPFKINRYDLKAEDNSGETYHYHDFCEITCIEEGEGIYHVGGKDYEVSKGDIMIFNNVEPHGWTITDKNMKVLVLIFSAELVTDPLDSYIADYMKPFIERGSNFRNKLEKEDARSKNIYELLRECFTESEEKEAGYKNIIKADVIKIMTFLIRHYQREDMIPEDRIGEKKQAVNRLGSALEFINEHFTENISLDQVSAMVFMSPNYFSSYFRKICGYKFSEYITIMRLKKARSMYISSDKSATEIALSCGFRNMSNFYRLYKKYLGALPGREKP